MRNISFQNYLIWIIEDPSFQNYIIYVINRREDFQKFLLGSSDIGENIQEGINLVVANN